MYSRFLSLSCPLDMGQKHRGDLGGSVLSNICRALACSLVGVACIYLCSLSGCAPAPLSRRYKMEAGDEVSPWVRAD